MYKIKDKYKDCNLLIKICIYLLHFIGVLIRGSVFLLFKLLYKVLRLWEFEKTDEVYLVKDNLTHSFNFKRSPRFKKTYHDTLELLTYYKIMLKVDSDNGTDKANETLDEIVDSIDELIVLAESESLSRAYSFFNKRRNGFSYGKKTDNEEMSFYLENYMRNYGNDYNDNLDNLK